MFVLHYYLIESFWQCKQQTVENVLYYYNTEENSDIYVQARILITFWYDQTLPKPIGPIPPNWAPRCGYLLSAVQVHTAGFTENNNGARTSKGSPCL